MGEVVEGESLGRVDWSSTQVYAHARARICMGTDLHMHTYRIHLDTGPHMHTYTHARIHLGIHHTTFKESLVIIIGQ